LFLERIVKQKKEDFSNQFCVNTIIVTPIDNNIEFIQRRLSEFIIYAYKYF